MYVPLDVLPELTPEYQQGQQQAVLDAKVVYEYEIVKEHPVDYVDVSMWSLFGLGSLWLIWLTLSNGVWLGALLVLLFSGGLLTYFYYAGNPDVKQTVTLTEKGMIVTELTLVPEACYAALRYSGYAGIAISIVGVIVIGPMMFVGAGAGLLMSFKMAGVTNRPRQRVLPFHSHINYKIYDVPECKYKNGLIQWHLSPLIKMENDGGDREIISRENRIFYFTSYAASSEQQHQFLAHLNQFTSITEGVFGGA